MKSIKPGRGPSFMGGIMSIAVALFGVIWTAVAASSGGGLFALFGIVFIFVAVVQAVYNFRNASAANRYSEYDITDEHEEYDPLNKRFGKFENSSLPDDECSFCPYCGAAAEDDFAFCKKCGKKLPE